MNPFDLRGPAFLALYALVSAGGLLYMWFVARGMAVSPPRSASSDAHKHLRDPYLMAYLYGGYRHTLTTVIFSLHQRGIVFGLNDAQLRASTKREVRDAVHNTLEREVLRVLQEPRRLHQVRDDKQLKRVVEAYVAPLRKSGLIADDDEYRRRFPTFLLVGGVLLALAVLKVVVAVQRGHSNVGFLIALSVIALIAAWSIFYARRTHAGDRALRNQQTLLARLKDRIWRFIADGATSEAVLVAATFGLAALPTAAFPFARQLRKSIDAPSNSGGCGSSSGCGGGGCGGGCGGCGG